MRRRVLLSLILGLEAAIVVGFVVALRSGTMPLGVRGEWEWLRVPNAPEAIHILLAGVGLGIYATLAALLMGWLSKSVTPRKEAFALAALLVLAVMVQGVAHMGAPAGYGLEKWVIALHQRGSSGYFTVAKMEVREPSRFLKDYPTWIQKQDALHLGTHPPGLILLEAVLLHAMEANPALARKVVDLAPESVAMMLRIFGADNPMTLADRATLVLTGALTLLACSATVLPLYRLARNSLSPAYAFASASLWPLVPSAIMFQPTADTAFALISTLVPALAMPALKGPRARSVGLGILCGGILGIAMQFTLAFLAVGLIVALVTAADRRSTTAQKWTFLLATGSGFLGFTLLFWWISGANPFLIWWWNQKNHARFYEEFPRSYRAWVMANPIELAVGLGLPCVIWAGVGLSNPRGLPPVSVATLGVLTLLTLGGRNLSEVGRLWIPFMPALLVAAGYGMERLGAGPKSLGATIAILAIQLLALEATIQVVYPI